MSYPKLFVTPGVADFAEKVDEERQRQIKRWGPQPLPDGTGVLIQDYQADVVRDLVDASFKDGAGTHALVLLEEAYEVLAETDTAKLKVELIQLASVCAKWLADIDSRPTGEQTTH